LRQQRTAKCWDVGGLLLTSATNPMPEATGYLSPQEASFREMRSAPLRFLEAWGQTILGFVFCILFPILIYAQAIPFAGGGLGVAELTILATAFAYLVVTYCGSRLEAFPGASVMEQAAYVAPIVTVCFGTIGIGLLGFRLDYSRVQFFGSGFLVFVWMLGAAQLRTRLFTRSYAVVPATSLGAMPGVRSCRWLDLKDALARSVRLDGIVADLSNGLSERELSELARAAIAGVPVLDRRHIVESLTGRTPLSGLSPNEFGALLPSRQYVAFRRIVELVCTVAALPALLPVMLLLAVIVRLDSAGPIFYTQMRVGRQGRAFQMVKFRTMLHGAVGPSFTTTDDPRITSVGSFLRRYRLDELPQVLNVLKGEMSWVGPRPEALSLGQGYARDIPHFELRGIVPPGVTGWAQINQGYAHDSDGMRAKLEYDLYYLKHCSLWLDLVIILRTLTVVLGGIGAR
jgi:lipopolysaccharide/colanic/teichoic acid biosynthesis glycosyltransferase